MSGNKLSRSIISLWVWMMSLFALALMVVSVLIYPRFEKESRKQNLSIGKQKWSVAKITNYRETINFGNVYALQEFQLEYLCGLGGNITLTVQDNHVISVLNGPPECLVIFQRLTLDQIFNLAEKYLDLESPNISELEFNNEYGYVSLLVMRYSSGGHPIWIRVSELLVLQKSSQE